MLKGCKHYGNKTVKRYENGGYVEDDYSASNADARREKKYPTESKAKAQSEAEIDDYMRRRAAREAAK